jgi:hypothetical protein
VDILAPGPMMPMVLEKLAEQFTLHRLWEMDDKEGFIKANAHKIRGLATGGHVKCDSAFLGQFPHLEIILSTPNGRASTGWLSPIHPMC